jgi:hypothetical protein
MKRYSMKENVQTRKKNNKNNKKTLCLKKKSKMAMRKTRPKPSKNKCSRKRGIRVIISKRRILLRKRRARKRSSILRKMKIERIENKERSLSHLSN